MPHSGWKIEAQKVLMLGKKQGKKRSAVVKATCLEAGMCNLHAYLQQKGELLTPQGVPYIYIYIFIL